MSQDNRGNCPASGGAGGVPPSGSGAGADSALAAMLRKRQQRAEGCDSTAQEPLPEPPDQAQAAPRTP